MVWVSLGLRVENYPAGGLAAPKSYMKHMSTKVLSSSLVSLASLATPDRNWIDLSGPGLRRILAAAGQADRAHV